MVSVYDTTSERDVRARDSVRGAEFLRHQWSAILAGSVAGLGALALMSTLGAALGLTATAAAASARADAGQAAAGIGMGVILWTLLTALVVGVVGGSIMKHLAVHDTTYRPAVFGTLNWACGLLIAGLIVSLGSSGLMAGVGSAGAATAAFAGANSSIVRDATHGVSTLNNDRGSVPTDAERAQMADAAEAAAKTATALAWTALVALLVGLGATIVAAGKQTATEREHSATAMPAARAT